MILENGQRFIEWFACKGDDYRENLHLARSALLLTNIGDLTAYHSLRSGDEYSLCLSLGAASASALLSIAEYRIARLKKTATGSVLRVR